MTTKEDGGAKVETEALACCFDPRALLRARPFAELRRLPPDLRVPRRLIGAIAGALLLGFPAGWFFDDGVSLERFVRAAFTASAAAFFIVVAADFAEHFRLERELTGRALRWQVVPIGETLLHGAIGGTLAMMFLLARPLGDGAPMVRDWLSIAAPLLFVGLGWADEIYYHRRRAMQREHILHTVSHLTAAATLVTFAALRFIDW